VRRIGIIGATIDLDSITIRQPQIHDDNVRIIQTRIANPAHRGLQHASVPIVETLAEHQSVTGIFSIP
jgi:hypothetical protein